MKCKHPIPFLKVVHESRHAVIAAVQGLPTAHVTIQPGDAGEGHLQPDPLKVTAADTANAKRRAQARADSILAGCWRAVLRPADELYLVRTITGERVEQIVAAVHDDERLANAMVFARIEPIAAIPN